jgi:hypothetical protein
MAAPYSRSLGAHSGMTSTLHAARSYGAHAIAYSSAGPGASRRDGTGDGAAPGEQELAPGQ